MDRNFLVQITKIIRECSDVRDRITLKWMAWIIVFLTAPRKEKLRVINNQDEIQATLIKLRRDLYVYRRAVRTTSDRETT